jgi:hypothetical protein
MKDTLASAREAGIPKTEASSNDKPFGQVPGEVLT